VSALPARKPAKVANSAAGKARAEPLPEPSPKLTKTRRKAESLPPVNKALEPFVSALADLLIADLLTRPLRVSDEKK
jgi:hypothetical protein